MIILEVDYLADIVWSRFTLALRLHRLFGDYSALDRGIRACLEAFQDHVQPIGTIRRQESSTPFGCRRHVLD